MDFQPEQKYLLILGKLKFRQIRCSQVLTFIGMQMSLYVNTHKQKTYRHLNSFCVNRLPAQVQAGPNK